MSSQRIIWLIAGIAILIAVIAILGRDAGEQAGEANRNDAPAAATDSPVPADAMIAALQNDPEMEEEKTRAAVDDVAQAAEKDETDTAEGQYALGLYYTDQYAPDLAEKAFRAAIEKKPDWAWAYTGLGILLANQSEGRADEAEGAFRTAISLDASWYRPHNDLAVLLRLTGRFDEAEQEASKALEMAPYSVAAHNNYGNLLTVLKKYPDAESQYLKAIELNARQPKPYYNLGCLYALQKRKDEALPLLAKAIALDHNLAGEAAQDADFDAIRKDEQFQRIIKPNPEFD